MKYAVELDSGAMIYIRNLMTMDLAIQKSIWGIHMHTDTQTHRQHENHISLLLFFQSKERRLIMSRINPTDVDDRIIRMYHNIKIKKRHRVGACGLDSFSSE
jgi:hypothetical protein